MKRKITAFLSIALVGVLVAAAPYAAVKADETNGTANATKTVKVTVSNDTDMDYGTIDLEADVLLTDDSTMEMVLDKALNKRLKSSITIEDVDGALVVTEAAGLANAGESSYWMTLINGFPVDDISPFTYEAGNLPVGSVIALKYTVDYGNDLGIEVFGGAQVKTLSLGADNILLDYEPDIKGVSDSSKDRTNLTKLVNGGFDYHPAMGVDYKELAELGIVKPDNWTSNQSGSSIILSYSGGKTPVSYTYRKDSSGNQSDPIAISGVPDNWKTTESQLGDSTSNYYCSLKDTYFEWIQNITAVNYNDGRGFCEWNYGESLSGEVGLGAIDYGNPFVELNAKTPATLYQDLTTYEGDIIFWSFKHAGRARGNGDPEHQTMSVTIGPFTTDPSGTNINITSGKDTVYTYNYTDKKAVVGGGAAIAGRATDKGLAGLDIYIPEVSTSSPRKASYWQNVEGIYIVPSGQGSTRFAFQSTMSSNASSGNFMDDVKFQTLVGNLTVEKDPDDPDNIIVSGYWGAIPGAPDLEYKFTDDNGDTYTGKIDMSEITTPGGFSATVPIPDVTDPVVDVNVYPEGYPSDSGITGTISTLTAGSSSTPRDPNFHKFLLKFDTVIGATNPLTQQNINPGNHGVTPASNPGSPSYADDEQVTVGGKIYKFKGWYDGVDGTGSPFDFDAAMFSDKTAYAKWELVGDAPTEVTVHFDLNGTGAQGQPADQKFAPGGAATNPTNPTRPGYTFGGWAETKGGTAVNITTIPVNSGTKTYYAIWIPITDSGSGTSSGGGGYYPSPSTPSYKLEFETDHGKTPDTQTGFDGSKPGKNPLDTLKPGDISDDGYRFEGWYLDKDHKIPYDFTKPIDKNTTLYAKWEKVDDAASTGNNTNPTKPGDTTNSGDSTNPENPADSTQPLKDDGTPIENPVNVQFITDHGVVPQNQVHETGDLAQNPGAPMDPNTFQPGDIVDGWRFEGWFLDPEFTIAYDFNTPLTDDIVLYAKWTNISAPTTSPKTADGSMIWLYTLLAALLGSLACGGILGFSFLRRK